MISRWFRARQTHWEEELWLCKPISHPGSSDWQGRWSRVTWGQPIHSWPRFQCAVRRHYRDHDAWLILTGCSEAGERRLIVSPRYKDLSSFADVLVIRDSIQSRSPQALSSMEGANLTMRSQHYPCFSDDWKPNPSWTYVINQSAISGKLNGLCNANLLSIRSTEIPSFATSMYPSGQISSSLDSSHIEDNRTRCMLCFYREYSNNHIGTKVCQIDNRQANRKTYTLPDISNLLLSLLHFSLRDRLRSTLDQRCIQIFGKYQSLGGSTDLLRSRNFP